MKDTNREPVPVACASALGTVSATGLSPARGLADTLENPATAAKNLLARLGTYPARTNEEYVDKHCVCREKATEMVLLATSSRCVSARKLPMSAISAARLVPTLLGLILLLAGCSSQTPAERTAEAYWRALQTGELAQAYTYLSEDDRTFISEEAFSSRMRYDLYAHLFFSQYDGVKVTFREGTKGERDRSVASAEVTEVVHEGLHAVATARLNVPAYETLVGALTGALGGALSEAQEQRLERALRRLRRAPLSETWHRFTLIQEEGAWRVSYPRWRAEAMLAQAKRLAADKELAEAQTLLAELGRYAANLDAETRGAVTRAASRGRRTLPHLPDIQLRNFTLGQSKTCAERASLTLYNGSYDLRTATIVVDFEGADLRSQTFVLGKDEGSVAQDESAYFELCLEPPSSWRGEASARVIWLEFTEEVYKSRIE